MGSIIRCGYSTEDVIEIIRLTDMIIKRLRALKQGTSE
nr:MAG TPA: hypothetical protein [Caudoviricetes sp.]